MKIGKRIRELRKEKNMTLEELSSKSGVALATLSRMENNKMTGTLESHTNICKALTVSIADLYKEIENEEKNVENVPKNRRTEHFVHAKKATYELLVSRALDKKIMPIMMKISPGGATDTELNDPGVEKFIYLMNGTIEAQIGSDMYILKKGDSLYFDASLPHVFRNKTKSGTEAIYIATPPAL